MNRSRTQIASSYAPGALFTYEGGLGCCVAIPKYSPYEPKFPGVHKQLFEMLGEFVDTWHARAIACRQSPEVLAEQCLDSVFLDHKSEPHIDPDRFVFNQPSRIGFTPDPLVFVCRDCGLIAEFNDVADLDRRWKHESGRNDCPRSENGMHKLRQIDVVFAHWSGSYAGLSPARFVMDSHGRVNQLRKCKSCDGEEYRLMKNSSPFFSDWRFQCVKCLTAKELVQADRETLALLKPRMDAGRGNQPKEWNMLPVSYRASSVYYVQRETFILFKDTDVSGVLTPGRRSDLVSKLMKLYDFPGSALTHEEVERQLQANGRKSEAEEYQELVDIMSSLPEKKQQAIEKLLAEMREKFQNDGLIAKQHEESPILISKVEESQDWARRYNPIRLAIEHASLYSETIGRQGSDASLPAISVTNPEACFIEADDTASRAQYTSIVNENLSQLGIEELVLLRGLDICEFSFGFTRVSASPTITEKDMDMPVRLKAFDYVERNKRPIYLLEQKNEAFYVRLNEKRVVDWLTKNGLGEPPFLGNPARLGGAYITEYEDFGRFLEAYKERTSEASTPRSRPSYIYLLLHTLAHHFAQTIVEYSGLEHGSLCEYIFPGDLAFLIYRRGMTPDLGNLSAMWRNFGLTILEELLTDRKLKCDSGSLCDQRGGACPACIMAPEVACLTGNHLLCRSTLNGGLPPGWDTVKTPVTGYFRGKADQ